MRIELKEREKIFVNEQIKSDEELLKMLEEREKEMDKIFYRRLMHLVTYTRNSKNKSEPQSRGEMKIWKPL